MTINEQNFSNSSLDASTTMFTDSIGYEGTNQNGNGRWCGNAWGYNVYYSESSSINITLKLFKYAQQSQLGVPLSNNNFSFRLIYKFLKRTDAKLRYILFWNGAVIYFITYGFMICLLNFRNEKNIWTGDHVPGTYCNKNIYDCDRR